MLFLLFAAVSCCLLLARKRRAGVALARLSGSFVAALAVLLRWRALRRRLSGDYAHGPAAATSTELDLPAHQGEQRVVAATTYTVTRVEVRAALADEDLSRVHLLAAVPLDTEALRVGVTAVTAG
jgi:hypothetical protein